MARSLAGAVGRAQTGQGERRFLTLDAEPGRRDSSGWALFEPIATKTGEGRRFRPASNDVLSKPSLPPFKDSCMVELIIGFASFIIVVLLSAAARLP